MKSIQIHLKSVFFGSQIKSSGNDIDVFAADGQHMVAVRDGRCQSKALGCSHSFTLMPIPRVCRLFKEDKAGNIVKDEEFEARLKLRKEFLDKDGVVIPMELLVNEKNPSSGYLFDEKGNVKASPAAKVVTVAEHEIDSENL